MPRARVPLNTWAPELSVTANQVEPALAVTTIATGALFVATTVVPSGAPPLVDVVEVVVVV